MGGAGIIDLHLWLKKQNQGGEVPYLGGSQPSDGELLGSELPMVLGCQFDNFQPSLWKAVTRAAPAGVLIPGQNISWSQLRPAEKWELEADKGKLPSLEIP